MQQVTDAGISDRMETTSVCALQVVSAAATDAELRMLKLNSISSAKDWWT